MVHSNLRNDYFKNVFSTLLIGLVFMIPGHAQEFVDTTPQNKNVVLEEFTGLNCQFCPDGHRIADELKSNNPNSVVLVNIHSGNFAAPNSGQPDFRTVLGQELDTFMGESGYPYASINRVPFNGEKPLNRSSWKQAANDILSQSSPVNLAIQTNFDEDRRELTIDVEAYYTNSSQSNTNRLNIAVLQNNIPGPQIDGGNYYPENYYTDVFYNHKHMFRDFLTGQWGEKIENTSKGSLYKKTYTLEVPEFYGEIPVKPQFLEIAAYVAEGKQNIYTGTSQKVNVNPQKITDLAITKNSENQDALCNEIEVSNKSSNTITKFDAVFNVNGKKYTETISPLLEEGDKIQLNWSDLSVPGGKLDFSIKNIKGSDGNLLFDKNVENDIIQGYKDLAVSYNLINGGLSGQFRGSFEGSVDGNFILDDSENEIMQILYGENSELGALATSGSIGLPFNSQFPGNDKPAPIYFGKVDLSSKSNPEMAFYYAYSKGDKDPQMTPEIVIEVSEDCGKSWETIQSIQTEETASFSPSESRPYYFPNTSDYVKERFSIDQYAEKNNLIFKVTLNKNDGGNFLWFDELKVGNESWVAGIDDFNENKGFTLFPNPVSNNLNLKFDFDQKREVSAEVVNAQGKTVKQIAPQTINPGQNQMEINTASFSNGVYIAKMNIDGRLHTREFIVNH